MQRLIPWTLLITLTTVGCASTLDTGSFVDRDVNFGRYHTYNWVPPGHSDGDPRLEGNTFFIDHLQGEVEKQLAMKGFEGPLERHPDLLVRYRAAVTPRIEVAGTAAPNYGAYGYCSFDCSDRIREYETATLVIDVLDAHTRKIVWRGWARNNLDDVIDHQDRMERRIHEAVTEMMAKLPAHS